MKIGRNDPCSCGSGKKYKKCCEQKVARKVDSSLLYQRLRETEGRVMRAIDDFTLQNFEADIIQDFWEDFTLEPSDLSIAEILETDEADYIFAVWRQFDWAFIAEGERKVKNNHKTLAERFLRQNSLSQLQQEFIQAASDAPWCFYQITDVVEGQSLQLINLLTDEEISVIEYKASHPKYVGGVLYTKVLHLHGLDFMLGCAPSIFSGQQVMQIFDFKEGFAELEITWDADLLKILEAPLRTLYLQFRAELLNPPKRVYQNHEGHVFEMHRLQYQLSCSIEEALAALQSLALGFDKDDLEEIKTFSSQGELVEIKLPWLKISPKDKQQKILLGEIILRPGRLEIEVNSKERASRFKRSISQRLGKARTQLIKDEIIPMPAHLATVETTGSSVSQSASSPGRPVPIKKISTETFLPQGSVLAALESAHAANSFNNPDSPEMQQVLNQYMKQHWKNWITDRIPALNNQTPKQLCKTAAGRSRVLALINTFSFSAPEHREWLMATLKLE